MRAGIAFGSNLGDRLASLRAARLALESLPEAGQPVLASSVYESEAVNCAADAPKFLNAVLEIGWEGSALALLQQLRGIEAASGRPLRHARNVSRTLDLDLLYCGAHLVADADLHLPHPRLGERRFVLEPLAEIRPDLVLPDQALSVADLLAQLPATTGLVRVASQW